MKIFLSMMVILLFCTITEGSNPSQEGQRMKRAPQRYCGRQLVDVLNLLCEGQYYDPFGGMNKREADQREYLEVGPFYPIALQYPAFNGVINTTVHGRYKRGIVDECCRKACSPSVLITYCAK